VALKKTKANGTVYLWKNTAKIVSYLGASVTGDLPYSVHLA
jgi:hypothetical protein